MDKNIIRDYVSKYKDSYSKDVIIDKLISAGAKREQIEKIYRELESVSELGSPDSGRRKHTNLIWGIIIVLLLLIGVFSYLFYDDIRNYFVNPYDEYIMHVNNFGDMDNVALSYDVDVGFLGILSEGFSMKARFATKDGKERMTSEIIISFLGESGKIIFDQFNLGYVNITCTEGGFLGESSYSCKRSDDGQSDNSLDFLGAMDTPDFREVFTPEEFETVLENGTVGIEYNGSKKIKEWTCDSFTVHISDWNRYLELIGRDGIYEDLMGDLDTGDVDESDKGIIRICFERETSVPLEMSIELSTKSKITNEDVYNKVFGFNIISIDRNIDDSEFELPIKVIVSDTACSKDKIGVMLEGIVDHSSKVSVNNGDLYSDEVLDTVSSDFSIKGGETKLVEIDRFNGLDRTLSGDVCIDDICENFYCSVRDVDYLCFTKSNDKISCENSSDCTFRYGECVALNCYDIKSEKACNNKESCIWRRGVCSYNHLYGLEESLGINESNYYDLEEYVNLSYQ